VPTATDRKECLSVSADVRVGANACPNEEGPSGNSPSHHPAVWLLSLEDQAAPVSARAGLRESTVAGPVVCSVVASGGLGPLENSWKMARKKWPKGI